MPKTDKPSYDIITSEDVNDIETPEYILLVGKPKVGKSRTVVSLMDEWQATHPQGHFYIIDTEGGLFKEIKRWNNKLKIKHKPQLSNFTIYRCREIDEIISALHYINIEVDLGYEDWMVGESLGRIWDKSSNMAYEVVSGLSKPEYLSERVNKFNKQKRKNKSAKFSGAAPQPDQLWQVAANAYTRNFLEVIDNDIRDRCNVLLSTTEKPSNSQRKPKGDAKVAKKELYGDAFLPDGRPKDGYYFDTIIYVYKEDDGYFATVVGDRGAEDTEREYNFELTNESFYTLLQQDRTVYLQEAEDRQKKIDDKLKRLKDKRKDKHNE